FALGVMQACSESEFGAAPAKSVATSKRDKSQPSSPDDGGETDAATVADPADRRDGDEFDSATHSDGESQDDDTLDEESGLEIQADEEVSQLKTECWFAVSGTFLFP